jgi:general secretion pathway protein G
MNAGLPRLHSRAPASRSSRGFTLIEILIVITIISILLSIAIPQYKQSLRRAREGVLRENLYILRSTVQQYTIDKEHPPTALEDLVSEQYLRAIPPDITGNPDTWQVEYCEDFVSPEQSATGICEVRSGSGEASSEGTPYSTW